MGSYVVSDFQLGSSNGPTQQRNGLEKGEDVGGIINHHSPSPQTSPSLTLLKSLHVTLLHILVLAVSSHPFEPGDGNSCMLLSQGTKLPLCSSPRPTPLEPLPVFALP